MKSGRTMNGIVAGDQTELHRTISESDIHLFCDPVYTDDTFTTIDKAQADNCVI